MLKNKIMSAIFTMGSNILRINIIMANIMIIGVLSQAFAQENTDDSYLQTDFENIVAAWSDTSINHIFSVAHRANVRYRDDMPDVPENSKQAMEIAIQHGVDVLEVDLKETADGHFILMHDQDLNRTTTGFGPVVEKTLEEIKELRLVHEGVITDERVPTLEEALELTRGRAMINLDHISPILEPVLEIVQELDLFDHSIVKTRDSPKKIAERLSGFSLNEVLFMPLITANDYSDQEIISQIEAYQNEVGITAVELIFNADSHDRMSAELFKSIHDMGVRVWINTLWDGRLSGGLADKDIPDKSDMVWGTLLDHGVTIIQTDQAVYLRSYITSPHFIHHGSTTNYKLN